MKKSARALVCVGALFALSTNTQAAGGAWDGIYSCAASGGGVNSTVYITVNGYPDGRAIFALPAVTANPFLHGYGIGQIVGNVFSGTTSYAKTFTITQTSPTTFSGSAGVVISGVTVNVNASCTKIW